MPETREAACQCGQLRVMTTGEPMAVTVCHCIACQRRTGSAFATQAGFSREQVQVTGTFRDYSRISEEPDRREHVFHFCPDCGSQVFQSEPGAEDLVIVSVGAFGDPGFPPPTDSGYEMHRHPWVGLPDSVRRDRPELWEPARKLYEAGDFAGAAAKGREILEEHPDEGRVVYNTACCEARAGETEQAVEHLRHAIGLWDGCREMAKRDPDFDPIREDEAFTGLVG